MESFLKPKSIQESFKIHPIQLWPPDTHTASHKPQSEANKWSKTFYKRLNLNWICFIISGHVCGVAYCLILANFVYQIDDASWMVFINQIWIGRGYSREEHAKSFIGNIGIIQLTLDKKYTFLSSDNPLVNLLLVCLKPILDYGTSITRDMCHIVHACLYLYTFSLKCDACHNQMGFHSLMMTYSFGCEQKTRLLFSFFRFFFCNVVVCYVLVLLLQVHTKKEVYLPLSHINKP